MSHEGWEECGSDLGDGLLVAHVDSVVEGARADNAVLSAVHHEAAEAGVGWVRLIVFRKTLLFVDGHDAWDVVFSLKCLNLAEHEFLVLVHSIVNHGRQNIMVAFTAS